MRRLIGGQQLYTMNEFSFSNATVLCVGNSGRSITDQIRSEHGNIGVLKEYEIEQLFNLQPDDKGFVVPSVHSIIDGHSLKVDVIHTESIKSIILKDL